MDTIPAGLCQCGCGQRTTIARWSNTQCGWKRGEPIRYVRGHNPTERPPVVLPPPVPRLCACGCGDYAPIARANCPKKGWVRGQPTRYINGHANRRPLVERFWEKVDRRQSLIECWPWKAGKHGQGYGLIRINNKSTYAHRVAYELAKGPIPDGLLALHQCDNPACCRPSHLKLGTDWDNAQEAKERKRLRPPRGDQHPIKTGRLVPKRGEEHWARKMPERIVRGERIGTSKLTEAVVRAIRAEYAKGGVTMRQLGKKYAISTPVVSGVIRRQRWNHVA